MKKIIATLITVGSILGISNLFNAHAETPQNETPQKEVPKEETPITQFKDLQTHSLLKFTYDTTTFDCSKLSIKFGGDVLSTIDGYKNIENYEYGVIVLKYDENSEKTILQTTTESLATLKEQHYAKACTIDPATVKDDKFEYSWVITNTTDYNFTYTASLYRLKDNNLEIAKPISRSVRSTAIAYLNSSLPQVTPTIRNVLNKIVDSTSMTITPDLEQIKNYPTIDKDSMHQTTLPEDLSTAHLAAWVWGDNLEGSFIKVVDGKLVLPKNATDLIYVYTLNEEPNWNQVTYKTLKLTIKDGKTQPNEALYNTYDLADNIPYKLTESSRLFAWTWSNDKDGMFVNVVNNTLTLYKNTTNVSFVVTEDGTKPTNDNWSSIVFQTNDYEIKDNAIQFSWFNKITNVLDSIPYQLAEDENMYVWAFNSNAGKADRWIQVTNNTLVIDKSYQSIQFIAIKGSKPHNDYDDKWYGINVRYRSNTYTITEGAINFADFNTITDVNKYVNHTLTGNQTIYVYAFGVENNDKDDKFIQVTNNTLVIDKKYTKVSFIVVPDVNRDIDWKYIDANKVFKSEDYKLTDQGLLQIYRFQVYFNDWAANGGAVFIAEFKVGNQTYTSKGICKEDKNYGEGYGDLFEFELYGIDKFDSMHVKRMDPNNLNGNPWHEADINYNYDGLNTYYWSKQ